MAQHRKRTATSRDSLVRLLFHQALERMGLTSRILVLRSLDLDNSLLRNLQDMIFAAYMPVLLLRRLNVSHNYPSEREEDAKALMADLQFVGE